MASGGIKAIIAAQYDNTGLKKAQKDFANVGKSIRGALGAVGIGIGIAAITNGLETSAKAAVADVKAQALLATQLKNTVGATNAQIASNEAFIQQLQLQTSVLDDQLRPAMASLVRATGDVAKAQDLLALATDVSAATGKDLESVSLALGKAANGQTTALFRMIPGLKGSADWMGKLRAETAGAAATAANSDPFARLNVIFNDIQEQIGTALLPVLQEFANWFASADGQEQLKKFVDILKGGVEWLSTLAKNIAKNIDWLGPLATAIGVATAAVWLWNLALDANPILLVVSAVALLATAMLSVADNTNTAANSMKNYKNIAAGVKVTGVPSSYNSGADTTSLQGILNASKTGTKFSNVNDTITKPITTKVNPALEAAKKAAEAARKAAEEAAQAYMDALAAANDLMAANRKLMASFTDLFKTKTPLGEFEQAAVDAFSSIFDTIDSALADGLILSDAAQRLREYAISERMILQGIAKQRDILAGKLDVARSITTGVMGLLNITNLLETTSKSVTETVTSIIGGISVATTKTFDVVTNGGLVDNFQKLVDKTKAFAKNLVDLKKLGLNKQLFAQLVQAGADAGGATAQALVDGGSETIAALNDLYSQLALSAGDIAANATDTLYEVGQQVVSNGFIEGLLSQDSELQRAAQTLADAFASTFTSQLQLAVDAALPDTSTLGGDLSAGGLGSGLYGGKPGTLMAASMGRGTVYNVNVSAGVVTDPNSLAKTVIDSVKKYERSNGSVWVAA